MKLSFQYFYFSVLFANYCIIFWCFIYYFAVDLSFIFLFSIILYLFISFYDFYFVFCLFFLHTGQKTIYCFWIYVFVLSWLGSLALDLLFWKSFLSKLCFLAIYSGPSNGKGGKPKYNIMLQFFLCHFLLSAIRCPNLGCEISFSEANKGSSRVLAIRRRFCWALTKKN